MIQARQNAFRREQTDLSSASLQRLINHSNGSPQAQLRQPLKEYQENFSGGPPSNSFSQSQPGPIVPPHGKRTLDTNAMQKCLEELRQKR